jgi:hypothetical protein
VHQKRLLCWQLTTAVGEDGSQTPHSSRWAWTSAVWLCLLVSPTLAIVRALCSGCWRHEQKQEQGLGPDSQSRLPICFATFFVGLEHLCPSWWPACYLTKLLRSYVPQLMVEASPPQPSTKAHCLTLALPLQDHRPWWAGCQHSVLQVSRGRSIRDNNQFRQFNSQLVSLVLMRTAIPA